MTTLKPTTPMLAPNKEALKPASPLRPKTAPKTPISHPQRRRRFQSRLGRHPQRRWRFQTSGPAGLQGLAAVPVGGGGTRPGFEAARQARPQHTRHRRCGGRRRDRRARAGFEARRRAKRGRLASRAAGPSGARNTRRATSNTTSWAGRRLAARTARGWAAAHGRIEQPGLPQQAVPGTPAEPQAQATTGPHACGKPRPAEAGRGLRYPVGYQV